MYAAMSTVQVRRNSKAKAALDGVAMSGILQSQASDNDDAAAAAADAAAAAAHANAAAARANAADDDTPILDAKNAIESLDSFSSQGGPRPVLLLRFPNFE